MIPKLLADSLSVLNFEELNSRNLYLLTLCAGILIAVSFYLLRLFYRRKDGSTEEPNVRLNCWFCSQDVDLQSTENDSWKCPYCEQYNGFTKDGDYIQPVREQFDVKDYKIQTVCSPSDFTTAKSVLCETCSLNQVLKVRQLAAFTPFCDASYDDEVDKYSGYLETRYSLCDMCRQQVCQHLSAQDKKLASTMKDQHLSLLDQLQKMNQNVCKTDHTEVRPRQSLLPRLMFVLCVCAAVVHGIVGWTCTGVLQNTSNINQTTKPCLFILPDWLALWGGQASVCCGAVFCTCGLFLAGKHSLYPEDAVHLLLWLVLIVMTLDLSTSSLSWLCLTRKRILFVDAGTNLLSLACCLRNRLPRHFTAATIHKKHISQLDLPVKEHAQSLDTRCEDEKTAHASDTSLSSACPLSPPNSRNAGTLQFDDVQQDLECLSLGLTKRTGSSSSIWSLPAVVSASSPNTIPDSTTDRSAQCFRQPPGILSPSRLGFLNLDYVSRNTHDNDNLCLQVNKNNSQDVTQGHLFGPPGNSHFQPEMRLSSDTTDKPLQGSVYTSDFRPPTTSEIGPCDSQTSDGAHLQLLTFANGTQSNWCSNILESATFRRRNQPKNAVSRGHTRDKLEVAETSAWSMNSRLHSRPSRTQRSTTAGKSCKPWTSKKSFSFNNICTRENLDESSSWRGKQPDVSKDAGGGNVSSRKNSILKPDFLPAHGFHLNSQTSVTNASEDRHRRQQFLPADQSSKIGGTPLLSVSEFSDDDWDEKDNDEQTCPQKSANTPAKQKLNDFSWTWMLVGIVIGASLTTNIFLVCQGWLTRVDRL